ncbi:hypothetical protein JZ751_019921 [Albula glossodonta]|uniref:Uncharacterized protein n=1 Tax=Albula glossodonta TaxID=121402 RepID=A0A8T2MZW5_9TELE|nr:hypothetical protein JZ751_019921 [Albula glossodonta]
MVQSAGCPELSNASQDSEEGAEVWRPNRDLVGHVPVEESSDWLFLIGYVSVQESSNGPVKRSMREKAIDRRSANKEHNSNFKAGYVPIEEERLHKTGLRGRKGNLAVCIIVLLFLLALINLIRRCGGHILLSQNNENRTFWRK